MQQTERGRAVAEAFGANVGTLRKKRGLSQASLAERLSKDLGRKIDPTAVTRIERGQRQVTIDEALALADLLEVSVAELAYVPAQVSLMATRDQLMDEAGNAWGRLVDAVVDLEGARAAFGSLVDRLTAEPFNMTVDDRGFIPREAISETVESALIEGVRRVAQAKEVQRGEH